MAYSNWGGFVFTGDGRRRTDREDVAVFNDDEADLPSGARIFANLAKNLHRPEGQTQWYEHSHHVVLGDGPVRLCGYKLTPELWHRDDGGVYRIDLDQFVILRDVDGDPMTYTGEYAGATFSVAHTTMDGSPFGERERLLMRFTEADGVVWHARCGMGYGAGFGGTAEIDDDRAQREWQRWTEEARP